MSSWERGTKKERNVSLLIAAFAILPSRRYPKCIGAIPGPWKSWFYRDLHSCITWSRDIDALEGERPRVRERDRDAPVRSRGMGEEEGGGRGSRGPGEGQGVMRTVHPSPMSDNEPGTYCCRRNDLVPFVPTACLISSFSFIRVRIVIFRTLRHLQRKEITLRRIRRSVALLREPIVVIGS